MSLRRKIFLAIGCLLAAVMLAAFLVQQWILATHWARLEEQAMRANITRIHKTFVRELAQLERITADWARWDDTYEFIENGNAAYIHSNLTDAAFENLRLNVMVFVHSSGRIVASKTYDLHHRRAMPFLTSLLPHLTRPGVLLDHPDERHGAAGILTLPEGPLLVVALPILTSQDEGPARGTLIFGRFLDEDEIAQLGETIQLPLIARPWNDPDLPTDFQTARATLTMATPSYTRPLDDEVMAGYTLLADVYAQPALILRTTMPRDITQQGRSSQLYLMMLLLFSGILTYALAMWGLDRLILARVDQLAHQVHNIGEGRASPPRVAVTGNDEVGTLEREINRMLEEIARNEQRWRAYIEQANDFIFALDASARLTLVNRALCDTLGYTAEEFLGKSPLEFVAPDARASAQDALERVLRGETIDRFETVVLTRAQQRITLEVRGKIFRDNKDTIVGTLHIARDITARKKIEDELRRSRKEWQDIFNAIGHPTFILDPEHRIIAANPAVLKHLGKTAAEVLGKHCYELFHHATCAPDHCPMEALLRSGKMETVEMEMQTVAGTFLVSCTPVLNEQGALEKIIHIATDITELKRVQTELQEANARFFALVEGIPDIVYLKDAQGRNLYVNKAYEEFVGMTRANIVGKRDDEFMPADLAAQCAKSDAQAFQTGTTIRNEEFTTTDEGKTIWLETIKTPIRDASGKIIGLVGISRDITERKRAEVLLREYSENLERLVEARTRELREAQEQLVRQERLATLGQLAGSVAHELRSPLSAIKNAAYYLNMRLEHSTDDTREMLQILDNQVNVSARIIESLLDFARPKVPVLKRVYLPYVIQAAVEQCRVPDSITLEWQVMPELPDVLVDAAQMQIVFRNLITNAIQAMPGGGHLTIGVRLENGILYATVSDTGHGIPPDALDKIFQPLYTTKAKGIGLGLAMCKLIVEAHDGTISVTSEVGKGSTFTVALPAER